ncbi:patatin-like phospholipase family protein [Actinomadura opuntiae]|uniref:patatin-like phospholipase family protein n=1 Tax=Actinomadura sp. OS1-43 TaxID=604315 RepID=UPI00255B09FB|nr:patatin-like phospholipase family protein [Actinomadura sp. OS1-43]MDL4815664.1 patatin-like phospholipase family protein [Actinomadura sp. OS1-43]
MERGQRGNWALVLGPGGPVGTAWLAGLAAGLREAGVDPAAAEPIAGTSAGAIAGAMIAAGRDLAAVAELPPPGGPRPAADPSVMERVFGLLRDPALAPDEARRRVGGLAMEATALPAEWHRERMRFLVGTDDWPDRPLLITGVDVASGEPVVWDRTSGVPLSAAVAASSAAPGYARPVEIGGRFYMDGAFGGGSWPWLAEGADAVVLIEPFAHMSDGSGGDVRIVPDEAALEAFGGDVGDVTRWSRCYRAGVRQAPEAARLLATVT